ncbi:uncharacterized protein [Trachinotus anak]|uniref:uncharacterized protein isoform X3 n=1 Tax=Trachinotus anak TaxID=443729 RepID=UPI0039F17560
MFCVLRRRQKKQKKHQDDVETGDKQSSSPQKSLNIEEKPQETVVPDTPATSATTVSPPTETGQPKTKKTSWWRRWFGHKKKTKHQTVTEDVTEKQNIPSSSATEKSIIKETEDGEAGNQEEASPTPHNPVPDATELQLQTEIRDIAEEGAIPTSSATEKSIIKETEDGEAGNQEEASPTPHNPVPDATELQLQTEIKDIAEEGAIPTSSATEKSIIKETEDGEAGNQEEASPTPHNPVPDATELQLQTEIKDIAEEGAIPTSSATEKSIIKETEDGEAGNQEEASPTPHNPVPDATELQLQTEIKDIAEEGAIPTSSATEKSIIKETEDGEAGNQEEASPTPHNPVPDATELQLQTEIKDIAEEGAIPTSSATEKSIIKETEDGEAGNQEEASPTPHNPVPAATELQLQTEIRGVAEDGTSPSSSITEKSVNAIKEKEDREGVVQEEASPTPEKKKKKKPWWRRLFSFCRKKKVIPIETNVGAEETTETKPTATGHGGSLQRKTGPHTKISGIFAELKTLSRQDLVCLGFPNLAQTCYMNSTLQSLLTLTDFVQEVHNQEEVWRSHPHAEIMRAFVKVGVCRFSNNKAEKKSVLASFKHTVAEYNSEFEDDDQKDAHEFLSCVLDMLRSLTSDLQTAEGDIGIRYTCPISAHIAFQMLSTRTCKGCGIQSKREEDHVNLSLDLVPGGSVSHCLQDYLKENRLDYHCECGAEESTQQSSFFTLPNVLILQLKRFRFTRSFNVKKVTSPVVLSRELEVNLNSSCTKQTKTCYSLVSIISHLGSTAHSGHYICDGAYREPSGDLTDSWLTYNDKDVSETTGTKVCQQRKKSAYLLFYEKRVEADGRPR